MFKMTIGSCSARLLPVLTVAVCTVGATQADIIHPVSATTDDPIRFGSLDNIIDGVVDFNSNVGMGTSNPGDYNGPYTIAFDLGASFNLTGFQLWNNGGSIEFDGEGIDAFTLRFLDDGSSELDTYAGNAQDILAMQEFMFSVDSVRSVELVIESNHSDPSRDYVVLYEVAFIPAPGALAALCAFGLVGSRRRR
jgi:hypothetical protein